MRTRRLWPIWALMCLVLSLLQVAAVAETRSGHVGQIPVEDCQVQPDRENFVSGGMTLSAERTTIGIGEKLQLTTSFDSLEEDGTLTYRSSKPSVVSVGAGGVVTGKKRGTAVITANTPLGKQASLMITVVKAPSSVQITAEREELGVGESLRLGYELSDGSAGAVTFSVRENPVLSVTPQGLVTGLSPGSATVTLNTFNGKKASIVLTVLQAPERIYLSEEHVSIGVGDHYQLSGQVNEGASGTFRFVSLNPEIVQIDAQTGLLTAVAQGRTTVIATVYNGISASMEVTVLQPPQSIALSGMEQMEDGCYVLELSKGKSYMPELASSQYSCVGWTMSSSDPSVVEIDPTGYMLARRSGVAHVEVRAYCGACAHIVVKVQKWMEETHPLVISHAMGGIDGKAYSNSLEAFEENYAEGHRYFEVDMSFTFDGELVLWHDWAINRINHSVQPGYVPSKAEFAAMPIFDRYTSLSLEDLFELMLKYPDIWIVSDTKETSAAMVRRQFTQIVNTADRMGARSTLSRWIVYLYSKNMYDVVESIYSFDQYAFALYRTYLRAPSQSQMRDIAAFCDARGIEMIVMSHRWWKAEYAPVLNEYDVEVALYTVNSAASAQKYFDQGVAAVITDELSPGGG